MGISWKKHEMKLPGNSWPYNLPAVLHSLISSPGPRTPRFLNTPAMQTFDSWVEESRKAACQIHIEKTNTEWFHHCALHGMDGCFPESYYEDLRRALCKLVEHWYSEGDDPGIQGCYAPVGEVFRFSDLCTFRDESMLRLAVLVSRAWAADQKLRSTAQEAALVRGELQEELQGCADSVNKLLGCSQQGQRFPCIPDVTTCSASDLLGWASSALEWIRSK